MKILAITLILATGLIAASSASANPLNVVISESYVSRMGVVESDILSGKTIREYVADGFGVEDKDRVGWMIATISYWLHTSPTSYVDNRRKVHVELFDIHIAIKRIYLDGTITYERTNWW